MREVWSSDPCHDEDTVFGRFEAVKSGHAEHFQEVDAEAQDGLRDQRNTKREHDPAPRPTPFPDY